MLMANQQAEELAELGIGTFHDPSPLVSPHFVPIVVALPLVVLSIRRDQFDGRFFGSSRRDPVPGKPIEPKPMGAPSASHLGTRGDHRPQRAGSGPR